MAQQGLFKRKPQAEPRQDNELLETARRTRMLEERYSGLERRNQVIEENMLDHNKKLSSEIRSINEDIGDIKKSLEDLHEKMQVLAAEMQEFAKRDDVLVIKKYLDYWQPLNFVTQKQVEKIVQDLMEK